MNHSASVFPVRSLRAVRHHDRLSRSQRIRGAEDPSRAGRRNGGGDMRLRTLAACVAIAGTVSGAAIAISDLHVERNPCRRNLPQAGSWMPQSLEAPLNVDIPRDAARDGMGRRCIRPRPAAPSAGRCLPTVPVRAIEPPLSTWSRDIAPGETLDFLAVRSRSCGT